MALWKETGRADACAMILAAGTSSRMGFNKQLAGVGAVPVVIRTALAFEASERIGGILLVTRGEDIPEIGRLARDFGLTKLLAVVSGGETRQQSAMRGVREIDPERFPWVAVQDGARPLVTPDLIDRVLLDAGRFGAAIAGVPVKDTIKRVDGDGRILETLDRAALWQVQTPQAFRTADYRQALAEAARLQLDFTDDSQLYERLGLPVHMTMGAYTNLKLTTPEDFALAEALDGMDAWMEPRGGAR